MTLEKQCFFCCGKSSKCDCGKFDQIIEDTITAEGQQRIDDMKAQQEYIRNNPPKICVEKSSKGMTCWQVGYYCGNTCGKCAK